MSVSTAPATSIGQQFIERLVAKDRDALMGLMAPHVRLHGMAPGRSWETQDAQVLVDDVLLGDFFGPEVEITELVWARQGLAQDLNSASYQLYLLRDGLELECEQHVFFDLDGGLIHALHLMCSGIVPRVLGS